MNDEEKKAIKIVNSLKEWGKIHFIVKDRSYARLTYNEVYLLLNLIEKLQKENEELKLNNEKYTIHLTEEQYKTVIENAQNDINQKLIQKVKDKIEGYKNMLKTCNKAKDIDRIKAINERILELEELLEGRK